MTETNKTNSSLTLALIAILLACVTALYYDIFPKLLFFWDQPDYSHAYMIPFLMFWIFWTEKEHLAAHNGGGYRLSWMLLALTVVLYILGSMSAIQALVFASIWSITIAILGMIYGDRGLKTLWALAVVGIFAIPWPAFIFRTASFQLRLLSSQLSELMLRAISIPVYREGNIIDLGLIQLEVIDACSGLRYLLPSILMSILAGWMFLKRPFMRFWLILLSIPVAIFSNAFRIMITGILCRIFGASMAEGFFHDFSGWLVYIISLVILLGFLMLLRKYENSKPNLLPAAKNKKPFRFMDYLPPISRACIYIVVVALLIGIKILSSRPAPTYERMDLANFPTQIGDWNGQTIQLNNLTLLSLGTDQVFNAIFVNQNTGDTIYLLITYYPEQDSTAAAHAPTSCLLGSGWSITQKTEIAPEDNINNLPIGKMLLSRQNSKIISNFWFQQRGRLFSNEFANKFYLFIDAIKTRRTDGGLVRIELIMRPNQTEEDGQKMLDEFITKLRPELPKYIPGA